MVVWYRTDKKYQNMNDLLYFTEGKHQHSLNKFDAVET